MLINLVVPNRLFLLVALVLTLGCSSSQTLIGQHDPGLKPALDVFLRYAKAAKNSVDFESIARDYFHNSTLREFKTSRGWGVFPYTASYEGLKNGECDRLDIVEKYSRSANRILLKCEGPYNYIIFGEPTDERMVLRVYMILKDSRWFIEKSSLTHTQGTGSGAPEGQGNYRPISKGLKFPLD